MAVSKAKRKPQRQETPLVVETWPLDRITPYPRNARKIPESAVSKVAASIETFGFRQPIVVDSEGVIIAGHTRLLAAQKLGLTEAPVHVARELTPAAARQYRLMDNRSHQETSWDDDMLGDELADLRGLDLDLALTGFDDQELADLFAAHDATEGLTDEDEVPAVPDAPVTQPGDLWRLGGHRLLCGDSTKAADVSRVLGRARPHLMVTDPPYGFDYDPNWRNDDIQAGRGKGAPGGRAIGLVKNDNRSDWTESWALFPGAIAYVWHGALNGIVVASSLINTGFLLRSQIIWNKTRIAISRGHYHWQHEPCWYAVRKGGTAHWSGDRKQSTVWDIEKPRASETGHSTQKPVECMRRPLINNSKVGDAVYDPFLGSGSTLIACETESRTCYGLEIDPAYCDVIVERWENFTGQKATREQAVAA